MGPCSDTENIPGPHAQQGTTRQLWTQQAKQGAIRRLSGPRAECGGPRSVVAAFGVGDCLAISKHATYGTPTHHSSARAARSHPPWWAATETCSSCCHDRCLLHDRKFVNVSAFAASGAVGLAFQGAPSSEAAQLAAHEKLRMSFSPQRYCFSLRLRQRPAQRRPLAR